MSGPGQVTSLYDIAPVILWVEDALTKEYLNRLWRDDRIGILVAGGKGVVSAATNDARKAGFDWVFGLRDRDFGKDNFSRWTTYHIDLSVFRLPRHEIENYLLDWDALAFVSKEPKKKTSDDIEQHVKACASEWSWWIACISTLFKLNEKLTSKFPENPARTGVKSSKEALDYILSHNEWHDYVRTLPGKSFLQRNIRAMLKRRHESNEIALKNSRWIEAFPGSELLGKARSFIGHRKGGGSKTEADIDLARAVAEWQVNENRRPADLMALRECLLKRTGPGS